MNITIIQKKENILIGRMEVQGKLEFDAATPSNSETIAAIAKELKTTPELVVMKHIYTKFGHHVADFQSFAYKTAEDRKKMETQKRKKADAAKKEGEAKAEA